MHLSSLYAELLDAALRERELSGEVSSLGESLAELKRSQRQVTKSNGEREDAGWATAAVADQVAYDVALVRYARSLNIDCDPGRFGWPHGERQRLEWLASRGIPLD
jgi:hypothetical protein